MLIEIPTVVTYNEYKPAILAIILTKNKIADLIKVIDSLFEQKHHDGSFVNICVAVGDTGSDFDNRLKWKKYWETLSEEKKSRIIKFDKIQYHFAKNCNEIVEKVINPQYCPEILLFVNNDVEIIQENTIDQMLNIYNLYPNIGTVGLQSLFHINFVQHQGQFIQKDANNNFSFGHIGYNTYNYDFLPRIVTGNSGFFMMVKTELFYKLGKFNVGTQSCFEDLIFNVDCLVNGYLNICVNSAIIYHSESDTRKKDPKYQQMMQNDIQYMNSYLNFKGTDGVSRGDIISPFVRKVGIMQ